VEWRGVYMPSAVSIFGRFVYVCMCVCMVFEYVCLYVCLYVLIGVCVFVPSSVFVGEKDSAVGFLFCLHT